MTRPEILALLEWPLGEDNMVPRMHSKAKSEWRSKIMQLGNYIVSLEQKLEDNPFQESNKG